MSVHDDYDTDNAPPWLTEDVPIAEPDLPSWAPPDTSAPQTIEVTELVEQPRAAFDLEAIRAGAPPVLRRAIDRLVRGAFHPEAAAELRELAGALKVTGLEAVIEHGLAEWERKHPPKPGRNGHRDTKPAKEPEPPVDVLAGSTWLERAEATAAWGALPTVPIYLPTPERGAHEILRLKPGGIIVVIGGTGRGKTSMCLEASRAHAQWTGPAAFFGLELSIPETGARLVGQHVGAGWMDAAALPLEQVRAALDVPRAHLFGRMSLADLAKRVHALLERYKGLPLLCTIDYAQILMDDMTERLQFAAILERLRLLIQGWNEIGQVIVILTSQGSRGSSTMLSSGEALGADTTATGAESAQLERLAYVTIALGVLGDDDGRGWRALDLNVGKSRMGEGDVVLALQYHGKSGRFSYAGEIQKASELREQRAAEKNEARQADTFERSEQRVRAFMERLSEPVAPRIVEERAGGKGRDNRSAIARMLTTGEILEVGTAARSNWKPPIILAKRAQAGPSGPSSGPNEGPRSPSQAGPGPYVVGPGPLGDAGDKPLAIRGSIQQSWARLTGDARPDPDGDPGTDSE